MPDERDASGLASGQPEVAVITPTKNRLPLLREALDSVAAQTFSSWEHIVVDDGSDDGTDEEMAARTARDSRVRYLKRERDPSGANACRNIGVRASAADLVVFLDSDDLLDPDCLSHRVMAMARNRDCDFVTFQTSVFVREQNDLNRRQELDMLGDDLGRFLFLELPWIITAPIWRKATLLRLGLLDETLLSWQDVDLHIRAITAGCRYLRFDDVDHHVRWQFEATKVSVEQRRSPKHLAAADMILEKFETLVRDGPGMTWVRQRALCSLYFFIAERWVAVGDLRRAMATWALIRKRNLGSGWLQVSGAMLLALLALNEAAGARVAHKWKGWARLRTNPELLRS